MSVPTGYVAVQPKGALAIKLHLLRENWPADAEHATLCRLYPIDRILPDDHVGVDEHTPLCGTCRRVRDKDANRGRSS
jgi:hypothetical protein